ncbi:MAG: hypothetical protein ACREPW_10275, partial [Candidatus Binataceae bacterium]
VKLHQALNGDTTTLIRRRHNGEAGIRGSPAMSDRIARTTETIDCLISVSRADTKIRFGSAPR